MKKYTSPKAIALLIATHDVITLSNGGENTDPNNLPSSAFVSDDASWMPY